MTISTATLRNEFWPTGTPSPEASSSSGIIVSGEFSSRPLPLPNTISLETLTKNYEADPEKTKYLSAARKKIASDLYTDECETLTYLRLGAGLSQTQLAIKTGSSQPHIARIELGQNDPGTELIARIASALGVDETLVFRAIRNQLATRRLSK